LSFKVYGLRALTLAALGVACATTPLSADNHFKGKTINVYIGYDAGGSYDFYGRMLARHMGPHLPGEPRLVPQNMPGAAGFRALGFLYSAAPKDGTAISITSQQIAIADKLGMQGVSYDASKFNYIGRITSSVEIGLFWHTSKVKSLEDARQHSVPVSATAPGSSAYDYWKILNTIGGTKLKIIGGYQSATPMLLAMERGETEGAFTSWNTLKVRRNELLRDKLVNVVVQFTTERHPDLKDVPALVEAGRTEEDRQILALYASGGDIGRAFIAPPGMNPDIVSILRRGFDAMVQDKQFLAEIEKTNAEFDPMSGAKLQDFVKQFDNLSPDLLERARKARE
jgi:tripartite-type tricarboxylate transporter receptor subunit TctC